MTALIIIFGALTLLAGVVIVINPPIVFGFLQKHVDKPELHILAVVVRLLIGILLIVQANVSRFPAVIEVLGWLSIIAAVVLALLWGNKFNRLIAWAIALADKFGLVAGVLAVAFGSFLIYAFV